MTKAARVAKNKRKDIMNKTKINIQSSFLLLRTHIILLKDY